MDRGQLIELLKRTLSEVAEKEFPNLGEDDVIADMGVDSLQTLEMVGEMERELAISIPDDSLVGIQTVKQLIDLIEKRVADAAG